MFYPPPLGNPLVDKCQTRDTFGEQSKVDSRDNNFQIPSLRSDRVPVPRGKESNSVFRKATQRELTSFKSLPNFKKLRIERNVAEQLGILNPFFLCHEGMAKATTTIGGKEYVNFSTYDYLDLNGNSEINAAVCRAIDRFGTSAGASRLVAGERPLHRELETQLAKLYQAEDCVAYVSGHATNVSTIADLFGPGDVIFQDSLSHNSIVLGADYSRSRRIIYPHNDIAALENLLKQHRNKYERALIVTEGVFSMDGDVVELPGLIDLKQRFSCFLMLDEAHALGVLGERGYGSWEHFHVDPRSVDLWMGTLSKSLCGCGGYICGTKDVVELLKFTSPSFVYSVGLSPALTAASLTALKLMKRETWRTLKLQENSQEFLHYAQSKGLDTGKAEGFAIVPIMIGSSLIAGKLATRLFRKGINVMPIIYPVVEEGKARLRFFLSACHTKQQIHNTLDIVSEQLPLAAEDVESVRGER